MRNTHSSPAQDDRKVKKADQGTHTSNEEGLEEETHKGSMNHQRGSFSEESNTKKRSPSIPLQMNLPCKRTHMLHPQHGTVS